MTRKTRALPYATLLFLLLALLPGPSYAQTPAGSQPECGLAQAAFCDTFDQPANGGTRSGDLNPVVWGVSRTTGNNNPSQGVYNGWFPTTLQACDGPRDAVTPPNDVVICNGTLREATNDGHTVTTLAMYPKQPMDWSGRTGKIVFDVTNDTQGSHGMWPEIWLTDLPTPAPFTHSDSWLSYPPNAFGLRLDANAEVGQFGLCPNGNNLDQRRWTVGSAVAVRNYAEEDTDGGIGRTNMTVTPLDCVTASSGPDGMMNHVEVDVSQGQIDVYATDAGASQLKHIATITNANLSFSRGLVWLEDSHYNASKSPCIGGCPDQHTFTWDNVGFDGPITYHDLSFDAPDGTRTNSDGSVSLGQLAAAGQTAIWTIPGLPANPSAQAVRVLFNFTGLTNPTTLNVMVNGHPHSVAWPYPDNAVVSWRTLAVTVPMTDLVAGGNAVQIGGDVPLTSSNVNIVLVNVDGTPAPTATPVPTMTPTMTPSPTVTPTATPSPSGALSCNLVIDASGNASGTCVPS